MRRNLKTKSSQLLSKIIKLNPVQIWDKKEIQQINKQLIVEFVLQLIIWIFKNLQISSKKKKSEFLIKWN